MLQMKKLSLDRHENSLKNLAEVGEILAQAPKPGFFPTHDPHPNRQHTVPAKSKRPLCESCSEIWHTLKRDA